VRGSKTDNKNIELLKLTSHLRDHIDVERIIGLNADALRRSDISAALLGHLQMSALDSLAICICKMFESSNRNELNSIPGIIASLAGMNLSENQREQFSVFGRKYGNRCEPVEGRSSLEGTFGLFCGVHSESLNRLKEFRDRFGAHSESRAAIKSLPPQAELECFFEFARDFYEIISRSVNNVGPAVIPRKVGHGLVRLIESMGVRPAKFYFDEEDREAPRPTSGCS